MRTGRDIERAIRATSVAGLLAAASQVVVALWRVSTFGPSMWTAMALLTALLLLAMVFGVTRHSRAASVGLLMLYVTSQIFQWRGMPQGLELIGGMIALVLVFLMVRGIQACFVFHRMERRFDQWQRTMDSTLDPRLFEED